MNFDRLGVLVVPPYSFHEDGVFSLSFGEADARLLFYLTYFRRVAVAPMNVPMGGFGFQTSTELEQTLAHQKIVEPIMFPRLGGGSMGARLVTDLTLPLYEHLNDKDPGKWAYAPPSSTADYLATDGSPALMLALQRCLPAPRPDVPANEILSFRDEHDRELRQFHHALDKVTEMLAASGDPKDATRIIETELALTIEEIAEAFHKAKIAPGLVSLGLSFNVPEVMISGVFEAAILAAGGPPVLGSVLGGMVSVGIKRSRVPRGGNQWPRTFEYVASGFREGIIAAEPASERLFDTEINRLEFRDNQGSFWYPEDVRSPPRRAGSLTKNLFP
jgi:hypothetical protein